MSNQIYTFVVITFDNNAYRQCLVSTNGFVDTPMKACHEAMNPARQGVGGGGRVEGGKSLCGLPACIVYM